MKKTIVVPRYNVVDGKATVELAPGNSYEIVISQGAIPCGPDTFQAAFVDMYGAALKGTSFKVVFRYDDSETTVTTDATGMAKFKKSASSSSAKVRIADQDALDTVVQMVSQQTGGNAPSGATPIGEDEYTTLTAPCMDRWFSLFAGKTQRLSMQTKTAPPPELSTTITVSGCAFAYDNSFPTPGIAAGLRAVSEIADTEPGAKFGVFAHADKVGSDQYNKKLSDRRAKAAFALLTNDLVLFDEVADDENWPLKHYQAMLRAIGVNPGPIDGADGQLTTEAVTAFQTEYNEDVYHRETVRRHPNLTVNGVLGEDSKAAIRDAYLAEYSIGLEASRCLGPKYSGCSEFNHISTEDKKNRRMTFAVYGKNAPDPSLFPCKEGDPAKCPLESGEMIRCKFYREWIGEPNNLDRMEDIPFWDFQWFPMTDKKSCLSVVSIVPDETKAQFDIHRINEKDQDEVPQCGVSPFDVMGDVGPSLKQISGKSALGICYAVFEHTEDFDPYDISTWLENLDFDPFIIDDEDHGEPDTSDPKSADGIFNTDVIKAPVFTVNAEDKWGCSGPPGHQLKRVKIKDASGELSSGLTNKGNWVVFDSETVASTASDTLEVVSVGMHSRRIHDSNK